MKWFNLGICYTKITPQEGKWCKNKIEHNEYKNICNGSVADCVAKGKEKCWSDDNCFGITYPGTGTGRGAIWVGALGAQAPPKFRATMPKLYLKWGFIRCPA